MKKKIYTQTIGSLLKREYHDSKIVTPKSNDKFDELLDFVELVKKWEQIVGTKLNEHTAPLRIKYKTLIVLTDHPAYSHQLSFLEKELRKKMAKIVPAIENSISKISFQLHEQHFIIRKQEIEKIIQSTPKQLERIYHPFDPKVIALKQTAQQMFQDIEDEDIKQNLCSIYLQLHYPKN